MMKFLKNKLFLTVFILCIISIVLNLIYVLKTKEYGGLVDNLFGLFNAFLYYALFILAFKEIKGNKEKIEDIKSVNELNKGYWVITIFFVLILVVYLFYFINKLY